VAANFEAITTLAKQYAEDVRHAMPVRRAVLFGSYAKGTASELSDVDICFFLETFNGRQRFEVIVDLLSIADKGKYGGIFFEPLAFPVSEIERGNPFVREILETGKDI
jgi:predicted nucleotidyltransferase